MFHIVKTGPRHRAFIEDTFLHSVSVGWPWRHMAWNRLREDFRKRFRGPGVRTAVAVLATDPDEYMGWAAVDPLVNWSTAIASGSSPGRS